MTDEWSDLGDGETGTADRRSEFTAHLRPSTFNLTRFERQQAIGRVEVARLHLTSPVLARQTLRLIAERRRMRVTFHAGHFQLSEQPWTARDAVQFLVRQLRRYVVLREDELRALFHRWRPRGTRLDCPDPRLYPGVFVPDAAGHWTLTTWVRLNVPFHCDSASRWGWGREGYVREAARFWLERGHSPGEAEEWDAEVRGLVAATLATPPPPPYFVPSNSGPFGRATVRGWEAYRLDPDRMPEGPYFTLRAGGVVVTYSVEGRAFLADTARGVNVVTPFMTRRILEALGLPPGDPSITWLGTGLAFRETMQGCGLSVEGGYRGF